VKCLKGAWYSERLQKTHETGSHKEETHLIYDETGVILFTYQWLERRLEWSNEY
jgi:hypothetical protein